MEEKLYPRRRARAKSTRNHERGQIMSLACDGLIYLSRCSLTRNCAGCLSSVISNDRKEENSL